MLTHWEEAVAVEMRELVYQPVADSWCLRREDRMEAREKYSILSCRSMELELAPDICTMDGREGARWNPFLEAMSVS